MRQPFERLVGRIDGRARAFAAGGGASPFALRLAEVSRTPLRREVVWNDRIASLPTVRHWASDPDRHRGEVEAGWGRAHYRRFQLHRRGCVGGFARGHAQAHRWVMARPEAGRYASPAAPPRAASASRG